jgi:hypothetical protein
MGRSNDGNNSILGRVVVERSGQTELSICFDGRTVHLYKEQADQYGGIAALNFVVCR